MNNSLPDTINVRRDQETPVTPLHVLVLLSVSVGAIVWGEALIVGGAGLQFQRYLALLAFYAAASVAFVTSRIRRGTLQLFEIPVFITCMFFLRFGLIPLRNFIDPTQLAPGLSPDGEELVRALAYCVLGMLGFWLGCQVVRAKRGRMFSGLSKLSAMPESGGPRLFAVTVALYAAGVITKFYLFKNQLYSYFASADKYAENLASMQVLTRVAQLGTCALIVATIERYRHKSNPLWKTLFVVIFSSEVLWGLISGMKGGLFVNFLVVVLVSSLIQRRLHLRWALPPLVAFVLLYPVFSAYRDMATLADLPVTSVRAAGGVGGMALQDATQQGAGLAGVWSIGLQSTAARLDLLTSVAEILTLGPRASFVRGDVPWWMLPIYPFVPRLLWPSKPILDEGARFTIALGGARPSESTLAVSSHAPSYPGDLYLQFGLVGIPIGMFLLGVVTQLFTNRISRPVSTRDLFVYVSAFLYWYFLETDVFAIWTGFLKFLAILYPLAWALYGPRRARRSRAPSPPAPPCVAATKSSS